VPLSGGGLPQLSQRDMIPDIRTSFVIRLGPRIVKLADFIAQLLIANLDLLHPPRSPTRHTAITLAIANLARPLLSARPLGLAQGNLQAIFAVPLHVLTLAIGA